MSKFEIKDINDWELITELSGGTNRKMIFKNPYTGFLSMFKYPRVKNNGKTTGEAWAEKLASELGEMLGVNTVKVELAKYNDEIGTICDLFVSENEELRELGSFLPLDITALSYKRKYIKLEELLDSIDDKYKEDILMTILFDALISNTDRSMSNIGFIQNIETGEERYAPLYDNGSSFCYNVEQDEINDILDKPTKMASAVYTKSKSSIVFYEDEEIVKKHIQIANIILNQKSKKHSRLKKIIKKIQNLKMIDIENIINKFDNEVMTDEIKIFLSNYMEARLFSIQYGLSSRKEVLDYVKYMKYVKENISKFTKNLFDIEIESTVGEPTVEIMYTGEKEDEKSVEKDELVA